LTFARILFSIGLAVCILFCTSTGAQAQQVVEDSLLRRFEEARNDSERVMILERLSDYYYAVKNFRKGDSLIEKQIILAESTLNPSLILKSYFNNAGYNSSGTSTHDRSQITKEYIERALAYAQATHFTDYAAMAYSSLSALNNAEGNADKAFKNASLGFTTALNTGNDSAKVICAIALGNVYLSRSDILTAFKTYINALNIAAEKKNET
jgi:hypothetical protein